MNQHILNKKYDTEIDGLRAIAVIAVLLFHFDIPLFSGGFIGVDIFFVISGFLITRIIINESLNKTFSLKNFYLRRIRRLFPALFFTLLATFVSSLIILSPEALERLSGSLISSILSVSNIYFWQQTGYFDTSAVEKPLLHTWSLSVEEQFYLIWPTLLILALRTKKLSAPLTIGAVAIFSLILCQVLLVQSPASAFFWMPCRAFEFAIGSLLYWLQKYKNPDSRSSEALAFIGAALLLFCIISYSEATSFPGWRALLPCLATAMLIQAGPTQYIGKILTSPPFTFIGKISYSLYLVHWPLVVFTKQLYGIELSNLQKVLLLTASVVLGVLLFNIIENPLRRAKLNNSSFSAACLAFVIFLVAPAASAWFSNGWAWRYADANRFLTLYGKDEKEKYVWSFWKSIASKAAGDKGLYIIGDSQGADILNSLRESGYLESLTPPPEVTHIQFSCGAVYVPQRLLEKFYGTDDTLFLKTKTHRDTCEKQRSIAFSKERLSRAKLIIVSPYWQPYLLEYLPATIEEIRTHSQANIIIVGQKHMLASSMDIYNKYRNFNDIELNAARFIDPETLKINENLSSISNQEKVLFFNPLDAICSNGIKCKVVGKNGGPVMFDTHHLTPEGASLVGNYLKDWLENKSLDIGG